jgi:hypothetical protein
MQYACNKHDSDSELCRSFQKKKSLPLLGQLIVFKGMLIGIYKSPDLFERKQFGLVFLRNFTHSQIKQKIEKRDPMSKDNSGRSFHTAITY